MVKMIGWQSDTRVKVYKRKVMWRESRKEWGVMKIRPRRHRGMTGLCLRALKNLVYVQAT